MSVRLAAGWALDSDHSVSVVPMIQCRPHGMTNSTLTGVRRMMPVLEWMRSLGTTRCTPLDARTLMVPRPPTISWMSSVQTPVALTTCWALISSSVPVSRSVPLPEEARDLGPRRRVRAEAGGGAQQRHDVPRVVDLRVPVDDRAGQRRSLERRGELKRRLPGQLAVPRQAPGLPHREPEHVVGGDAGADVGAFPGVMAEWEYERHRPYQMRREPLQQDRSLAQGLAHEADVELLQVAQAAVDQLARSRGGA